MIFCGDDRHRHLFTTHDAITWLVFNIAFFSCLDFHIVKMEFLLSCIGLAKSQLLIFIAWQIFFHCLFSLLLIFTVAERRKRIFNSIPYTKGTRKLNLPIEFILFHDFDLSVVAYEKFEVWQNETGTDFVFNQQFFWYITWNVTERKETPKVLKILATNELKSNHRIKVMPLG